MDFALSNFFYIVVFILSRKRGYFSGIVVFPLKCYDFPGMGRFPRKWPNTCALNSEKPLQTYANGNTNNQVLTLFNFHVVRTSQHLGPIEKHINDKV